MKHARKAFEGKITHVSLSPHGDPEGLVLKDGSFVKVPPHSLLEKGLLTVGAEVSGEGNLITEAPNRVFHHAQVKQGQKILADDSGSEEEREELKERHKADLKKRHDAEEEKVTLRGKVVAIATKPKGEVDRVILEGGTSVHLPKEIDSEAGEWTIGRSVEVSGKGRRYGEGLFVKAASIKHI